MSLTEIQLKALEHLAEHHGTKGIYMLHAYFCCNHPLIAIHQRYLDRDMMMHLDGCAEGDYYQLTTHRMTNFALIPPALLKLGFVEEAMYASQLAQEIKV